MSLCGTATLGCVGLSDSRGSGLMIQPGKVKVGREQIVAYSGHSQEWLCYMAAPTPRQERIAIGHPKNKKGSRVRDPYALSPSIRFRRGGTGPPREEETAAGYVARPMPEQRRMAVPSRLHESNGFTPNQRYPNARFDIRPLRFLTILMLRLHSLEYRQR
jgi:hypothetical protein